MDTLTDPLVHTTVAMFSAQSGKSEILNNMMGYLISHDPGPTLFLQPTLQMAEAYSKDRIAPMIRDTAILAELVDDVKSRDAGNTLLHKQFPGGHLTLAGANSPASLASRPIRIVLADEVDRYPVSAGTEGDPLSLAVKRTQTFSNSKIAAMSTPTVKGASRIEQAYEESDQRRFHVPCPHCGEFQTLNWAQVHWPEDEPSKAQYTCVHCAALWNEAERNQAVHKGQWRAGKPFAGIAGFHLNQIYSPWCTLAGMAQEFLDAKPYRERLRTFINLCLAETFEEAATAVIEPHTLSKRAEPYALGTVPPGVGVLVAAVDVQNDRLELITVGYGEGEECWFIDRDVIWGDPSNDIVWGMLLERLGKPLICAGGRQIVPRAVAIDSGGLHTQEVYAFVRAHGERMTAHGAQQILAIKGSSQSSAPVIGTPTVQELNWKGQRYPNGVKLWPIGVFSIKSLLYGRMKIEQPGAGCLHFSAELPSEFYDQLTAERLMTKYVRGFAKLEWEKKNNERNEALDCACYAYAMAVHLGILRTRPEGWESCRKQLHAPVNSQQTDTPPVTPVAARPIQHQLPRGNWATDWRR